MEQDTNKPIVIAVIITFVIAFWLGFFAGWLITGRQASPAWRQAGPESAFFSEEENAAMQEGEGDTARKTISTGNTASGNNNISAENQLAGRTARVNAATLDREGWVVIHEDAEGRPGAILGAAWLPGGIHENVSVDLLRTTEAGRRYYAMLHHEANGDGTHLFDLEKDLPMQDASGAIIMISFETIASPR